MPTSFLTATSLRTEPGKSRFCLLLTALSVSSLCLVSSMAHIEKPVAVAIQRSLVAPIQRDRARVLGASLVPLRTAQAAGSELVSKLGQMMGRTK